MKILSGSILRLGAGLGLLTISALAGSTPISVTIAATPNPALFGQIVTLTAAVSSASATGEVTFYDGVTVLGTGSLTGGLATLYTILLPPGTGALHAYYAGDAIYAASKSATVSETVNTVPGQFQAAVNVAPYGPGFIVVGDFNGDGKADLAFSGASAGVGFPSVLIALGNGDGTFQPPVGIAGGCGWPQPIGLGDFNGDGKADLAVGVSCFPGGVAPGGVAIYLGNGDGTFQAPANHSTGGNPPFIAVGDFSGDGKADLAVSDGSLLDGEFPGGTTTSILLGNGDRTFQSGANYNLTGSVAVGDFNRDGKADLVTGGGVLLGNGDGTFQKALSYGVSGAVVIGDFNGDGKADLAVADSNSSNVSVLLGNGDGTFLAAVNYAAAPFSGSIVTGDFNGDGKADLVTGGSLLFGNGDGTFQAAVSYAGAFEANFLAVGAFTGDGRAGLAASTANGVSVILNTAPNPDLTIAKSHTGNFTQGQTGAVYTITVSNSGTAATSGTVMVTDKLPAGLTATGISGSGWNCTPATVTCSRSDALATSVSYPTITLTVNVAANAAVSVTNTATVFGGGETNTSNDTASDLTHINITEISQTITFAPLSSQTLGTAPLTLAATASSGLSVSFISNTNTICTVSGSIVTLVTVGTCSITATQGGNASFAAAAPVTQNFAIQYAQTIITLRSGNGTLGGRDSALTFLLGPTTGDFNQPLTSTDFSPAQKGPAAFIVNPNPAWIPQLNADPLAQWVGTNPNAAFSGNTALYAIPFTVSTAFGSATLTLSYAADDTLAFANGYGGVLLNGTPVCANQIEVGFTQEHTLTCANVGSFLTVGTNWLYLDDVNIEAGGGLLFSATIATTASLSSNPQPVIASLSPTAAAAGSVAETITITGSGFVASSSATFNGVSHQASFINSNQLTMELTASDLSTAGNFSVAVTNTPPGGGTSNSSTFTVSSVLPSIATGGVVNAASFASGPLAPGGLAAVFGGFLVNGTAQATGTPWPINLAGLSMALGVFPAPIAFASAQQVNLQVPWELADQTQSSISVTMNGQTGTAQIVSLAAFSPGVFATNGTQGAILSSPSYQLVDSSNPATAGVTYVQVFCTGLGPVTNQPATGDAAPLSPLSWTTAKPTVTVGGVPANILFSGLTPTLVGVYQVNFLVPAGAPTGSSVPVVMTIGGVVSNTVTMAVQSSAPSQNPKPTIASLSPASEPAGSSPLTLTITGTGFIQSSSVKVSGVTHPATVASANQITVLLSVSDLATAGTLAIVVTNPSPGGGDSNPLTFTVSTPPLNPQPTITDLAPTSLTAGSSPMTLTISGAGFLSSSSATYNGITHAVTFVSGSRVSIALTASDLSTAGAFAIVVSNPPPGGGSSAPATLTVTPPAEMIVNISGAWQGTWSANLGAKGTVTAILSQSGSAVGGTISFENWCLSAGTISGTISGNQLSLNLTFSGGQKVSLTGATNLPGNAVTSQYTEVSGTCVDGTTGGIAIGKN